MNMYVLYICISIYTHTLSVCLVCLVTHTLAFFACVLTQSIFQYNFIVMYSNDNELTCKLVLAFFFFNLLH